MTSVSVLMSFLGGQVDTTWCSLRLRLNQVINQGSGVDILWLTGRYHGIPLPHLFQIWSFLSPRGEICEFCCFPRWYGRFAQWKHTDILLPTQQESFEVRIRCLDIWYSHSIYLLYVCLYDLLSTHWSSEHFLCLQRSLWDIIWDPRNTGHEIWT